MKLWGWWRKPAPARPQAAPLTPAPGPRYPELKVSRRALDIAASKPAGVERAMAFRDLFPVAKAPPGVPAEAELAMDASVGDSYGYAQASYFGEGVSWPGFPYLAELTQRPEYRLIVETRAKEMTRKGFELTYSGEDDAADRIDALTKACEAHRINDLLRRFAEHDGFYGGGHIYVDTGDGAKPDELRKPLLRNKAKIGIGGPLAFRIIEPMWVYPNIYNSTDPLAPNYYRPTSWYVMGKIVHSTRLITGVSREMPDILKPAYSFRGLSLSQIAKPYIDNWLRTRQSVSDLIHSFSIMILKTNMAGVLQGGAADQFFNRIDMMNLTRDNRGTFVVDKETEEFENVAAPIAGLHELQAQSQEQMASISQMPLVKLLGIQPSGLNASSDGEIRVFYDGIHAAQEHLFSTPLKDVLDILQLNLFGEIDPHIGFKFVPLWQLDDAAQAAVDKTAADTAAVWIDLGVISPEEQRRALTADKDSPYAGLDPDDLPEPPDNGAEEAEGSITGNPAKSAEPKKEMRSGV
jgi:phage-related protein (TIGR01555 family)